MMTKTLSSIAAAGTVIGMIWAASMAIVSTDEFNEFKDDTESSLMEKVDADWMMQQQMMDIEGEIEEAERKLEMIKMIPEEERDAMHKMDMINLPGKIERHKRKLDRWDQEDN